MIKNTMVKPKNYRTCSEVKDDWNSAKVDLYLDEEPDYWGDSLVDNIPDDFYDYLYITRDALENDREICLEEDSTASEIKNNNSMPQKENREENRHRE